MHPGAELVGRPAIDLPGPFDLQLLRLPYSTPGHLRGSGKKKSGPVSRAAPNPTNSNQNRKTDCAMNLSQQAPNRNPGRCWKSLRGFTGKRGRPKPPNGPPPTQPTHYETQAGPLLSATGLMQSNQNCDYETTHRVLLFNLQPTIRQASHASVDFISRQGSIRHHLLYRSP